MFLVMLPSMCLYHTELYSISDLKPWTWNHYHLEHQLMFLQTLWCFPPNVPSQVAVLVLNLWREIYHGYIATAGLDIIIRVRISICILPAHTDLRRRFRCFGCCWCCTAAAGTPQPVSSVIFHATAVESGHQLVRSRGVAIILRMILTAMKEPHLNSEISLCMLCPNVPASLVRRSYLRVLS